MKNIGSIFREELFERDDFYYDQVPAKAFFWQAIDPAATSREQNDFFAHVTIATHEGHVYLVDFAERKFRLPRQVEFAIGKFNDVDPIRLGVEANAYQIALADAIKERDANVGRRTVPIYTSKDKVARAWKLLSYFERGEIHFKRSHGAMIDHLLAFPDAEHDDLFDALDLAVTLATRVAIRKQREEEPDVF